MPTITRRSKGWGFVCPKQEHTCKFESVNSHVLCRIRTLLLFRGRGRYWKPRTADDPASLLLMVETKMNKNESFSIEVDDGLLVDVAAEEGE
jgi:hypothetical protein